MIYNISKVIRKMIESEDKKIYINAEFEKISRSYILRMLDIYITNPMIHITITFDISLSLKIARPHYSGLSVNTITIFTTLEHDCEILHIDTYENINTINDVKRLLNKIIECFADYVEDYLKEEISF
jgi:hypothetical protein